MTKADRIRKLLAKGLADAVIADRIGCRIEYVRAIRNRARNTERYGSVSSPAELETRRNYRRERYQTDPEFRAKENARAAQYEKKRYQTDPEFRARKLTYHRDWYRRRKAEALLPVLQT